MTEVNLNSTIYGDWTDYLENDGNQKMYKCHNCRSWSGHMKVRRVTERTGGAHKEYKVVCSTCKHQSGVFWSKVLAERTWEAEHDDYYNDRYIDDFRRNHKK